MPENPGAENLHDENLRDDLPRTRYDKRDVTARVVLTLGGTVAAGVALSFLTVTLIFPQARQDHTLSGPLPAMPAPALQASPPKDMAEFRARELARLDGYGWTDRAKGRIHIPIERAMAQVAQEGIPGWPTTPMPAPGGTTPAAVPVEGWQ